MMTALHGKNSSVMQLREPRWRHRMDACRHSATDNGPRLIDHALGIIRKLREELAHLLPCNGIRYRYSLCRRPPGAIYGVDSLTPGHSLIDASWMNAR